MHSKTVSETYRRNEEAGERQKNLQFFNRGDAISKSQQKKIADEKAGSVRLERIERRSSETDRENKFRAECQRVEENYYILDLVPKIKGPKPVKMESSSKFINEKLIESNQSILFF